MAITVPKPIKPGIYNTDYFSGAQCAVYIGDVWIDEVTSISYSVKQARAPLWGYADTYFRDVGKGKVLVEGSFTINFKEAGYLFLVLDRYRRIMRNEGSVMDAGKETSPFLDSATAFKENIEAVKAVVANDRQRLSQARRNQLLLGLTEYGAREGKTIFATDTRRAQASLGGYPILDREATASTRDENPFEAFEDEVWKKSQDFLDADTRRADHHLLNPFDIYVSFGDYARDNSVNHTIQKLSNVYIIGSGKEVIIDGQPIQEQYSFIARNLV